MPQLIKWIDVEQGTQAWYDLKAQFYKSASRTAIVIGVSPFSNKEKLAREILNGEKPFQNAAMRQGVELEEYVRDLYNSFGDNYVPRVALNGEYLASLDGYDEGKNSIIEIKVSDRTYREVSEGFIPVHYEYQIQHQLMVTGAAEAYLVAYSPDERRYERILMLPDPEKWEEIKKAWDEFDTYLFEFKEAETEVIEDENALSFVDVLVELNEKKEEIDTQIDAIKKEILSYVNTPKAKIGRLSVAKQAGRTTWDYKSYLRDNNLKIPNTYKKEGNPSYTFRFDK
jgi:putative phage-type endonuclease